MRMYANATRRGSSFSVDILAAGWAACPGPAGADHQRLQVVGTGKTKREGAAVLALDLDLATGDRAASDEIDQSLCRQGCGVPPAIVTKLTACRSLDPVKVHDLTSELDGIAARDGKAVRDSRAVFYDLSEGPIAAEQECQPGRGSFPHHLTAHRSMIAPHHKGFLSIVET